MKHIDAASHTRGESQYISDLPPPAGMLHAAIFPSPVAHGNIISLDVSGALASEGISAGADRKGYSGRKPDRPVNSG